MWSASELHYEVDAKEYQTLPKRYQTIYKQFLAFFAPGDGVITLQAVKFLEDAIRREAPEEECFLLIQLHAEQIHAETYGLAIANVVPENEWEEVFSAIDNLPCVAAKAEFIEKYMYSDDSIGLRYLAGAFAEGTFFTALFALVFFFRRKNNFKTFCSANALIMRDETLHRDYNSAMAKRHGGFSEERAHQLAKEAVEIELDHLKFILQEPIDSLEADRASGLTIESVSDYVKTLADQVLILSGVSPCFNVNAMLPWMMDIGLPGKENFYETLVTKYSQISVKDAMAMAGTSHATGIHHQNAEGETSANVETPKTDAMNNPDDVDI
jgi:ribonucleoside-diphosphate reductase subunit M2